MKKTTVIVATPKGENYPEFEVPTGYKAPEGVKPGDTFEELATFRMKPDGSMCLVEVAGVTVGGKSKEEAIEEEVEPGVAERFSKYRSGGMAEMEDMMAGE